MTGDLRRGKPWIPRELSKERLALIVGDDRTCEALMRRTLTELDTSWGAVSFATAREALRFIDNAGTRIKIGLVDIGLPDITGIEVIRKLHARFSDFPFIMVVSVIATERYVLAAICAGTRGYLLKDDSTTIIAEALRQSLGVITRSARHPRAIFSSWPALATGLTTFRS